MTSPTDGPIREMNTLLNEYEQFLEGKAEGTREAYLRTVRHLMEWMAQVPGNEGSFQPQQVTQAIIEEYLNHLEQEGFSISHCARVKSTISNFAQFLIEEKGQLQKNPTRAISLHSIPQLAPQRLSEDQRTLLFSLIERAGEQRGSALFALGYWAGCRVSDLSWLQMVHTYVSPKEGWLRVGYKGGKSRDIDLIENARKPLYEYLQTTRSTQRTYVFTSQRSKRLTQEGIYYWFRTLKNQAEADQLELIQHLTFNDLRQDFAYRAREAEWSLEEVAHYLGLVTRGSIPVLQSTVPYLPVSREQVKEKLKNIRG